MLVFQHSAKKSAFTQPPRASDHGCSDRSRTRIRHGNSRRHPRSPRLLGRPRHSSDHGGKGSYPARATGRQLRLFAEGSARACEALGASPHARYVLQRLTRAGDGRAARREAKPRGTGPHCRHDRNRAPERKMTMLSLLAGITVLISIAWLFTVLLRRKSAALRHVVWTCAIAAILLYAPLRWRAPQHDVIVRELPAVFTPAVATPAVMVKGVARQKVLSLTQIAVFVWLLGSLVLALRLAVKSLQFRRILAAAKPLGNAGPVRILRSPHVPGPLVTGILRPTILLPDNSALWAPTRRRAVLAHELAHIRRLDPAILLVANVAAAVYWFHPLCWLAATRLRFESERACDDAALRIGLRPSGYAEQLLDLARLFNAQPAIPMATTSHLESRVKSILDPFVNRSFAARRTWLAAALITAAVVAPLTVLRLQAQGSTGTIIGQVSDPTGAVVARAQVIISNLQGGNKEVVKS